ncbi:GcrA family cell cycle regulator [Breoghania sp.]|uniref:GcrA family cell cycle regulator n=1 Tax=Breoghania sp. TaxID=2065378 RepID=UPI002AABA197|nr:GcrA family cell cycle regulator [Breoghania sp.]
MSNSGIHWTEDRIDRLKNLWAEGLSASRIAAELGGVSRNAVIGKVHRLGLSGRKTPVKKAAIPKRQIRKRNDVEDVTKTVAVRPAKNNRNAVPAVAADIEPDLEPEAENLSVTAEVIPMARYLTLLELGPNTCRWPIGDPRLPGFRFCGAPTVAGEVYCRTCAAKAYQPITDRSRNKARRHGSTGRR